MMGSKLDTGWVLIAGGAKETASKLYDLAGKNYFVKADGTVARNGIETVDGKSYLFREDGTMVKHNDKDVAAGKITVGGVIYKIADDDTAEPDHTDHKWSYVKPLNWSGYAVSTQSGTVVANFECSEGKETGTSNADIKVEEKQAKVAEGELAWKAYRFTATVTTDPTGGKISTIKEVKYASFRGGAWTALTDSDADWKAAGGSGDNSAETPGQTESEPAQSEVASYQSFNLFYADQRTIPVPGLSEALGEGTSLGAKADKYFKVSGTDEVTATATTKADLTNAAKPANSLITVGNGEFAYQLPVYYQKPSLKLSSTSGIRKKNDSAEYVFTTKVTEKKSSNNYEPIALETGDVTADSKLAAGIKSTDGIVIDGTTVTITTTAKASGKFNVQPKESDGTFKWAEPIALSYSIKESSNDVIELDKTTILMNKNVASMDLADPEAQAVTIRLNGVAISELPEGTTVSVDTSKINGKGVVIGGLSEDGKTVADDTVTFGYDSAITKGTFNVVFSVGKVKKTLKVKVADTAIDNKAVTYTVKTKMDVTKGQKMVLVPKLNTIGGQIDEEVTIGDGNTYAAQYYAESNKIVVGPVDDDWTKVSGNKFEQDVKVKVGNIPVSTKVKTNITNGKPTVKIGNVTFKQADFPGKTEDGEFTALTGETNILSTYKQYGKTFSLEPEKDKDGNALVTFTNVESTTPDDDGYFTDKTTKALVKYDTESGKILVKTTSASKKGSIKVAVKFYGQTKTINKSFSIKTVK